MIRKQYINDLHFRIGLRIDHETLWSRIIKEALMLNWTRDPFDRIIVAHASVLRYNLISKDQLIKLNFNNTIW